MSDTDARRLNMTASDALLGRISVIVPAHNAATTIGTALASIAGQTLPPAAVVVVDDGSTDNTSEEAAKWERLLPVSVVRLQECRGPALARDVGIRSTTNSCLALLDADDVWFPDHLATLVSYWAQENDLVGAQGLRWIPEHGVAGHPWPNRLPSRRKMETLIRENYLFIGTIFHRSLYDRAGGFRDGVTGAEDWDLWIRMVRHGARVALAEHPTVLYRFGDASLSANDRSLPSDLCVAQWAMEEAQSSGERRVARIAVRHLQARSSLLRAYELAREGRYRAARKAAIGALRGTTPVAARGVATLVAPARATRVRDAFHQRPSRMLRR